MFRKALHVAMVALSGLLGAACGGAPDDDAARLPPASAAPSLTPIDPTAPASPLYFGVTNHLHVAGDLLADVNLEVGAQVELEAVTTDDSPIRFELWVVHTDGHPELLNAFDVESGFVLTTVNDQVGDLRYILHFPAPSSPRDVVVSMTCQRTSGRCSDDLQPGETCLAGHACASGLLCAPSGLQCNATWYGGTCVIPNDDSACVNDAYSPVCGCDGVTYSNACLATASGAGVSANGVCAGVAAPR
jgi:hypothetical protein